MVFYIAQVAIAIGELHKIGILHRDLKLENILCGQDGYLKIIDFGLAKKLEEDQMTKTYCGTLDYMAPEILR